MGETDLSKKQVSDTELTIDEIAVLDAKIAAISKNHARKEHANKMWLSHHWPEQHGERCFKIGKTHICTRCASLYILGIVVAVASAAGFPLWPDSWDIAAIFIFAMPGTIAYVGEALGLFSYNKKAQVAATLITATAFGKGLSYEFQDRWSGEFWIPVFVFGAIWFTATVLAHTSKNKHQHI